MATISDSKTPVDNRSDDFLFFMDDFIRAAQSLDEQGNNCSGCQGRMCSVRATFSAPVRTATKIKKYVKVSYETQLPVLR